MHASNVEQPWEMASVDLIGPLNQIKLRKHMAPSRTRPLHQVDEAPAAQEGHKPSCKEVTHLCTELHIQQRLTPTYTPQCNPMECENRVMMTMIAQNIEKTQKTWYVRLMELQFAYNTATNSSTGHSPAYLNLGRELKPPGSLVHEVAAPEAEKRQHRIGKLHATLKLARAQMARSFQNQQKDYNRIGSVFPGAWLNAFIGFGNKTPEVGEKVLKKTHHLSSKANFNSKLAERYERLYTVIKKITIVIFNLNDERRNTVSRAHVKDLIPLQREPT